MNKSAASPFAPPSPLDRPIFVVGHPRSGTTLLASMLGRHPDIASTPESLFLSQSRFPLHPLAAGGPERLAQKIMSGPLQHMVPTPHELEGRLAAAWPLGERDLFALILDWFTQSETKPRVLEKTPLHLRHLDELVRWFPDAKLIWIVRDPRGCIVSLRKVGWATHDPRTLARQWVRNVRFALNTSLPEGSLLRVRYEDLLAEPTAVMERTLRFVEVPYSDRVFAHEQAIRTVKPNETGWKSNVVKPLMQGRANAWRQEIDPAVHQLVLPTVRGTLGAFGYDVGEEPGDRRDGSVERLRSSLIYSAPGIAVMRAAFPRLARAKTRLGRNP